MDGHPVAHDVVGTVGEGGAGEFVSYLDGVAALSAAPKRASITALGLSPGDSALDVGCGTGDDVRLLAEAVAPGGHAVGLDASEQLIAVARARTGVGEGVDFVVADAHTMPFADGQFAGARVDRTLQHVAEPFLVVAEMARVVRPGGRIVAMEPDWDTLVISSADRDTMREVVQACASGIRHPDAGRRLAGWFVKAGVEVRSVDAASSPILNATLADWVYGIETAVQSVGTAAAHAWLEDVRAQSARGAFVAASIGFAVVGAVPTPHD